MTEPDYAAVLALGERFRKAQLAGDKAELKAVLHDDIVWVLPGNNAVSGEAHGPDGVLSRFAKLAEFGLRVNIQHITAGRDGKIDRIDMYLSDIPMMDAYFVQ
jgi:uncharacterized protein